jgi:hypothetical protein
MTTEQELEPLSPVAAAAFWDDALREEDPEHYANKVYAQVVPDPEANLTWLQYWFFYDYNPAGSDNHHLGEHEGDWEMSQFAIEGLPEDGLYGESQSPLALAPDPQYVAAAQHTGGHTCPWSKVQKVFDIPVLYSAFNSHATYFGPLDNGVAFWEDEVSGEGPTIRPEVVPISETEGWVQWPGWWGASEAGLDPFESDSPHGPAYVEEHPQWADPTGWAEGLGEDESCGVSERPGAARGMAPESLAPKSSVSLETKAQVQDDLVQVTYKVGYHSGVRPVGVRILVERPGRERLPIPTYGYLSKKMNSQRGQKTLPLPAGKGAVRVRVVLFGPSVEDLAENRMSVTTGNVRPLLRAAR